MRQHNNTEMSANSSEKTLSLEDFGKIKEFLKGHTMDPTFYESRCYAPGDPKGYCVAIKVGGKFCRARYYQKWAVCIYNEEYIRWGSSEEMPPKIVKLNTLNKVGFHAPQGGKFYIYGRMIEGTREFVLERDDGTTSICRLHDGYNSEELLGVKIDCDPLYYPSE